MSHSSVEQKKVNIRCSGDRRATAIMDINDVGAQRGQNDEKKRDDVQQKRMQNVMHC